ncbi:chemotaxis protein CheW [Chromobacterium sp. IIBBL 290-4]|uniref:chemotaxis protein CheW n=1 Tax=Chromobacterium sp. IIBBL 290-4 TaxID=2953890 RepID=UPI0020B82BD7|nr:chemotaxis protein CheW [Chromobacterium sp. IIBBL 290-4]UTH72664.1 chemotaxis protein CheW [Chromobacterium sp. IIBBL 290-4]
MSQFHQVFFDETDEHLATMESLLLAMDVNCPESEDLNAVFRAAHSIKGGAATFGFSDMADLTHVLENLLDRVRKRSMALTAPMVDVFLQAKDALQGMLGAHKGGPSVDAAAVADIKQRLVEIESGASEEPKIPEPDPVSAAQPDTIWTLFVELAPVDGVDMRQVLDALAAHGDLTIVQDGVAAEQLPWVAVFTSGLSADEVAESLAFTLAPDQFRLCVDHGSEEGEDYGFFLPGDSVEAQPHDSAGALEDDGSFGLFEPLPDDPLKQMELDGSFGLFEPIASAPPEGSAEGFAHLEKDGSFGLFEPIAAAPAADEEGDGFGLYAQAPGVGVGVAAPATAKREAGAAAPGAAPAAASKPEEKAGAAASAGENSIRVNIEKVDLLLNLVGELVITQSMLMQSGSGLDPVEHERLLNGISSLQRNSRELQEAVMSIRMTPIAFVFNRFPRVVRDLATRLGKQVELKMVGENTELDKGFIEKLSDPLTHLVRNSLDHGIESPEARRAKGKSPTGRLTLRAFHQGGSIVIEVSDDGAGLNRESILAKARERGMAVHDAISDQEVWGLIFEAGFSTAAEVTDVSGRGVGMDVVKRNIQNMGGRIEIDSMVDVGTTMSIRLPLTLAIMDGMSVRVGQEIYVMPLGFILESLQPEGREIKTVAGRGEVVHIRGEYLPIIALGRYFSVESAKTNASEGILVIVESSESRVALLVDDLIGQQQFVVKNLETNYRKVDGLSGATILGDGQVALILDISMIARSNSSRGGQVVAQQAAVSLE